MRTVFEERATDEFFLLYFQFLHGISNYPLIVMAVIYLYVPTPFGRRLKIWNTGHFVPGSFASFGIGDYCQKFSWTAEVHPCIRVFIQKKRKVHKHLFSTVLVVLLQKIVH